MVGGRPRPRPNPSAPCATTARCVAVSGGDVLWCAELCEFPIHLVEIHHTAFHDNLTVHDEPALLHAVESAAGKGREGKTAGRGGRVGGKWWAGACRVGGR